MSLSLIKLFLPVVLTFTIGILITPLFTDIFYKYQMWKKVPRIVDGAKKKDEMSEAFKKLGTDKMELHTPRVGGMIIWVSVIFATASLFLISFLVPTEITTKLNFISKNQTVLPFLALLVGAIIGLVNDLMTVYVKGGLFINGFPRWYLVGIVALSGLIFSLWFYFKLGMNGIEIPFIDHFSYLGIWFIPFFVLVFMATFSSGVIDGIDGLAGGVMAIIFASLSTIAFFHNQIDIAAFSLVVAGAILAFLWFNIPPARFWMGETGMLGLVFCLVVIVFLTNTVLILPIIGFPLVITSASSFIQIISKKIRGPKGKIFLVAPLHHHFEALGWSREKITMRYWIISVIFAVVGVIVALL
jgi:phospho-N-acetylmuramoyl-pentapeptide-transferase